MNTRFNGIVSGCIIVLMFAWGQTLRASDADSPEAKLLEIRKIWDKSPNNDFTDLVRFKDQWFMVFREGTDHCSPDGKLRVLTSKDGDKWTSASQIAYASQRQPEQDLRDAKLCVTPDGRLMLNTMVWLRPAVDGTSHQSLVYFSDDGRNWSGPCKIGDPNVWIWRATWHKGICYGIGYRKVFKGTCKKIRTFLRFYKSADGKHWETVAAEIFKEGPPFGTRFYVFSETDSVFTGDDTCYTILRTDDYERDDKLMSLWIGKSRPPYTEWTWKDLGIHSGGPAMMQLPDGRILAPIDPYWKNVPSKLCWVDVENGRLRPFLTFPAKYNLRYVGMVLHDGLLWISYPSKHNGKMSIYLAKVKIEPRGARASE